MARRIGYHKTVGLLIFALSLCGCAGTKSIQLSKQELRSISVVSINSNVARPKEFIYSGAGQTLGSLFGGPIGGFISAGVEGRVKDKIVECMEKNGIDIGSIMFLEFERQLRESNLFSAIEQSGGDAQFILEVRSYGLFGCKPFGVPMCPILDTIARLSRPNGEVIWQKRALVSPGDERQRQGQRPGIYISDPELLRDTLQNAVHIAVAEMLADIRRPVD